MSTSGKQSNTSKKQSNTSKKQSNTLKKQSYKEKINSRFNESYLMGLSTWVYDVLQSYIEKKHLEKEVYINGEIFAQCVKDLVDDLVRYCQFHDIEYPNNSKICAYMASWIIKRKPIQLINEPKDSKHIFHNEHAAFGLVVEGTELTKTNHDDPNSKELAEELQSILYHLRYRNTDPRTMMLLIDALKAGVIMRKKRINR